jgi:hypothetical protein
MPKTLTNLLFSLITPWHCAVFCEPLARDQRMLVNEKRHKRTLAPEIGKPIMVQTNSVLGKNCPKR